MLNDARKYCVTASEIGAIAGNGKFSSRADVLRRKVLALCGEPVEFTGNAATQWGHDNEGDAIAAFELMTGCAVERQQEFVQIKIDVDAELNKWFMASATLDGMADGNVVEVKCPYSKRDAEISASDYLKENPAYHDQLQWQMMVTGAQNAYFVAHTNESTDYITVSRDDARIAELTVVAWEFWRDVESVLEDDDALEKLKNGNVRDDIEYTALAAEYIAANQALEAAQKHADECRKALLSVCKEPCRGAGLIVSMSERAGAVDYKKIPELDGVDLNKYRKKSSTVWTIREEKA